jgi:putative ABC transport system substrate-binding protein
MTLHVLRAGNDRDLDVAFGELAALGVGGLLTAPDPFFLARSARLGQISLAHRIPAIFQYREL